MAGPMKPTAHTQTLADAHVLTAAEIRWQRMQDLIGWYVQLLQGNRRVFESVVVDACKPKQKSSSKIKVMVNRLVNETVNRCGGNVSEAAKQLGCHRATVWQHMGKAIIVLLASAICSFAQRGTGSNPAAVTAAPAQTSTMFAPALSVIVPPTTKTNLFYNIGLVWDSVVNPLTTGYRIRYGTNIASGMTNFVVVSRVVTNAATATESCTVSNLAFKPTWYFQAATLYGTNQSEWSYAVQVQPPLEAVFTLSAVFPLYSSTNGVNWITNKIMTLVQTNPPGMSFFRSHLRQLDFQWTNNQLSLKPFSIP
jgi:hypothetical protein